MVVRIQGGIVSASPVPACVNSPYMVLLLPWWSGTRLRALNDTPLVRGANGRFVFLPVLLRRNRHTALCKFKVYSIIFDLS